MEYNRVHDIKPITIQKAIRAGIESEVSSRRAARIMVHESEEQFATREYLAELEAEMQRAAANLEFERAAVLRDKISALTEPTSERKKETPQKKVAHGRRRG